MIRYIKAHPLVAVMVAAILLRLLAAIFSKGFMASDDHFETVHVAYRWLQDGLFGADGLLHWKGRVAEAFPRFPLYTVALFFNMKLVHVLGFDALDDIMYGVRLGHALFSLIGIWAVYRIIEMVSGSTKWAAVGGLFMAAHFVMPFLAVRNSIEMVAGVFWVVMLYCLYRYRQEPHVRWLAAAGLFTGLAWMIRFQIVAAFWIIPLVLWYEYRRLRPPVGYGVALLATILLAGLADWWLMGTFMGSTINHVIQNIETGPVYDSSFLLHFGVILVYFIPPFSVVGFYLACRRRFFGRHLVLVVSTLAFVLVHTMLNNRQERFMISMLPALVVILVLALQQHFAEEGFLSRMKKFRYALFGSAVAINLFLLFPFTFHYGHRGLVEPLVRIERLSTTTPNVLFFSPDYYRNVPYYYGGFQPIGRSYCYSWQDLDQVLPEDSDRFFDYFLLYPTVSEDLSLYEDSLTRRVGPIEMVLHIEPSLIDHVLHRLNPKHNPSWEVWVYQPAPPAGKQPDG